MRNIANVQRGNHRLAIPFLLVRCGLSVTLFDDSGRTILRCMASPGLVSNYAFPQLTV
jgi:hypothetical protein